MRKMLETIATVVAMIVLVLFARVDEASATPIVPGEQFHFVFDELVKNGLPNAIPDVASGIVTLGNETFLGSGLFTVSDFVLDVTNNNNDCLTCIMFGVTDNLIFHSTTLGLSGTFFGSFLGKNGGAHDWNPLTLTDIASPTGIWSLIDDHTGAGGGMDIRTASGTYSPLSPVVPEPTSLFLLGSGLAGIGGIVRRSRLKKVA